MSRRRRKKKQTNQSTSTAKNNQSGRQQVQQTAQKKRPEVLERVQALVRSAWKIVLGVIAISGIGVWTLWPRVDISRDTSLNPRAPFAELFLVENKSIYPLYDVAPTCGAADINVNGINARGFSILNPFDMAGRISPDKPIDVTCRLDLLFGQPQTYKTLAVSVNVPYTVPWLKWKRCTASTFLGVRAADGTYVWTYRGAGQCHSFPN